MNKTPHIIMLLEELSHEAKDFSFGELLWSVIRPKTLGELTVDSKIGDIRKISDEAVFLAIQKAIQEQKDYE